MNFARALESNYIENISTDRVIRIFTLKGDLGWLLLNLIFTASGSSEKGKKDSRTRGRSIHTSYETSKSHDKYSRVPYCAMTS